MLVPLSMCSRGRNVKVRAINGNNKIASRLNSMGICCETMVEVVDNDGTLIIKLQNSKLALGFGLANKIMCEEI